MLVDSKVFLAIPNTGWIHAELVSRIIFWLRNYKVYLYAPTGLRPIPYARNHCVEEFQKSDCSHLWFVDSDTVPPQHALEALLSAQVAAVSGVVHQMRRDTEGDGLVKRVGMVMRRNEAGHLKAAGGEGVELIDACGSGCIMFDRGVFEEIQFPWYEERIEGNVRGSDLILCEKLADAGIKLHAHFGVVCVHRKEIDF